MALLVVDGLVVGASCCWSAWAAVDLCWPVLIVLTWWLVVERRRWPTTVSGSLLLCGRYCCCVLLLVLPAALVLVRVVAWRCGVLRGVKCRLSVFVIGGRCWLRIGGRRPALAVAALGMCCLRVMGSVCCLCVCVCL